MARRPRKVTGNKWGPHPNDAIRLAAVRWFACRIEMEAIQIYATDSAKANLIEDVMAECITKLHELRPKPVTGEDGDCPPGYVMCGGECAPRCFMEAGISGASSAKS